MADISSSIASCDDDVEQRKINSQLEPNQYYCRAFGSGLHSGIVCYLLIKSYKNINHYRWDKYVHFKSK
jgi:hypothetical protein